MTGQSSLSEHADLVVVGSGAAGLTGALVAAIEGAKVLVAEKTGLIGGTTAISGGGVWIACNAHMADVGVPDSRDDALEYLRACSEGCGDDAHLVTLVDHGAPMISYLEQKAGIPFRAWNAHGGMIDYRPWLPGARHGGRTLEVEGFSLRQLGDWASRIRTEPRLRSVTDLLDYYRQSKHLWSPSALAGMKPPPDDCDTYWRGTALIARLLQACLRHGVEVWTEARVEQIMMADGRVAGLSLDHQGANKRIATSHVLMATGGFANNEELKSLWLNQPLIHTCEIEANQGDGHLMGQAVGAQMAGLGDAWWMPHIPLGTENGMANIAGTREDRALPHTLMVNSSGRRFMNEATNYYDCGEKFGARTGTGARDFPAWFLFDSQGAQRYMLLALKLPAGEKPDWLHRGETIAELASSIGVDFQALEETVDRFNGFARTGIDRDFHRGENPWDINWGDPENKPNPSLGTFAKAPFFALPVYPGATATRGGLRVDARGAVISAANGEPIEGLHAAGNCSNGSAAGAYVGAGATLGAAMTFSYVAALEVAARLGKSGSL